MSKIKVLDLARDAGMEDDKYLLKLKRMGVKVKGKKAEEPEKAASTSDEKIIERDAGKEVVEKRVKPTVIRRRTRALETKEEAPPAVEPAPPLAASPGGAAEPVVPEEKPLTVPERKAEPKEKVSVKAPEKVEGEKPAPTPAKPAMGSRKGEGEVEPPTVGEVKAEAKEVLPARGVEAQKPVPAAAREGKPGEEARREGAEGKPKVAVLPKEELRVPKKLVEEEPPPAAKKKAFAKKRRVIEERMLVEEPEEEESPEKGKRKSCHRSRDPSGR